MLSITIININNMMQEFSGVMLLGLPIEVSILIISGVFYAICALIVFRPYRTERNELIGALLAFLTYQAVAMVAMGIEIYTHNILYGIISAIAILVGSVYMLKFPLSFFKENVRKTAFKLALLIVLVVLGWLVLTPSGTRAMMSFTIWYDVFVNGVVVGFFMLIAGFKASERWLRVKALGGGIGVASCCIVSNVAMVSGAIAVSSVFQFLAPIIIISTLMAGRKMQKQSLSPASADTISA